MPELTFQERLCAGLKSEGWKETDRSAKYRVFIRNGTRNKFFVGKNGALRYGATRSNTRAVGDPSSQGAAYTQILTAGEKALNVAQVVVRDRLAALRAASQLQPTPAEPKMDAVEHNARTDLAEAIEQGPAGTVEKMEEVIETSFGDPSFDQVPCDTDLDGSSHEGGHQ